jgi:hypothetical protein
MTTERKRRANQHNAQRSTGPKTLAGKARSKQNALKHGLSVPVSVQPDLADLLRELESSLEWDIAPTSSTKEDLRAVLVAVLEVLRARSVRAYLLDQWIQHCYPSVAGASTSESSTSDLMQHLLRADRYERRSLSRRKNAIRSFSESIKGPG